MLAIVLDEVPGSPWYVCGTGEAFVVNLGATVQCGGSVWYTVLP